MAVLTGIELPSSWFSMKLCYSGNTNVGHKRQINQDSYGVGDPFNHQRQINQEFFEMGPVDSDRQMGLLLVVCDGMGGHTAGEVASRLGVETILEHYYTSNQADRTHLLKEVFFEANQRIYAEGEGNMGTTGVAALFHNGTLHIANVGDSRAYLIRNHEIRQITRDHSLVAEQVAAGLLTSEQARTVNYRNMITRALGYRPEVEVDIFTETVQAEDIILLSTDGMHGLIEDKEIVEVVTRLPPDQAVNYLIDLSNKRGGPDNITVVIGKFEAGEDAYEPLNPPPVRMPVDDSSTRETQPLRDYLEEIDADDTSLADQMRSKWPFLAALGVILVFLVYGGITMLQPGASSQGEVSQNGTPQMPPRTGANLVGTSLTQNPTESLPLTYTLTATLPLTATPLLTTTIFPTTTLTITTTVAPTLTSVPTSETPATP